MIKIYQPNNTTIRKTFKLSYISPTTWRQVWLIQSSSIYQDQDKIVHDRSSTIPPIFNGSRVKIYTGRGFTTRNVYSWMNGFKFGEFTWNRKIALYKAKQLRKKAKKKK